MILLAAVVLLGAGWGLGRRPAGARHPRVHMERLWLLGIGAVANAGAQLLHGPAAMLALAASLVALIAAAAANHHVTGVAVVGLGLLLNLAAVVLNDGMPVRATALVKAGVVRAGEAPILTGPRHLEGSHEPFAILGDVLPIGWTHEVLSFGDLIVIAGAADAVRELARRRSRQWTEAERAAYRLRTANTSVDHVWGTAPSAPPVSGSQYSANPDAIAPWFIDLASEAATDDRRELVAATQSR